MLMYQSHFSTAKASFGYEERGSTGSSISVRLNSIFPSKFVLTI